MPNNLSIIIQMPLSVSCCLSLSVYKFHEETSFSIVIISLLHIPETNYKQPVKQPFNNLIISPCFKSINFVFQIFFVPGSCSIFESTKDFSSVVGFENFQEGRTCSPTPPSCPACWHTSPEDTYYRTSNPAHSNGREGVEYGERGKRGNRVGDGPTEFFGQLHYMFCLLHCCICSHFSLA